MAGTPLGELALARYRCGRQADALESIRIARRTLSEQLGLEVSPDLAALELSILRQGPALAGPPEAASCADGYSSAAPRPRSCERAAPGARCGC